MNQAAAAWSSDLPVHRVRGQVCAGGFQMGTSSCMACRDLPGRLFPCWWLQRNPKSNSPTATTLDKRADCSSSQQPATWGHKAADYCRRFNTFAETHRVWCAPTQPLNVFGAVAVYRLGPGLSSRSLEVPKVPSTVIQHSRSAFSLGLQASKKKGAFGLSWSG